MKKKFYDISLSTAIIIVLGYILVLFLSIYYIVKGDEIKIGGIIFTVILFVSFLGLIVNYACFPVVIDELRIYQKKKSIQKDNIVWFIRRNYRLRYDEIIFRDKSINYQKMPSKLIKKHEIVCQYFLKYKDFLDSYIGNQEISVEDL